MYMKATLKILLVSPVLFLSVASNARAASMPVAGENLALCGTPVAQCDTVPPAEEIIYDSAIVDTPAAYPGGEAAIMKCIAQNLVYPPIALEQGLQGVVLTRFEVKKDGTIGHVKIVRSLSKECDKAATNAVRKLGRFKPASLNGETVPVWFILPVRFRQSH